MEPGLAKNIGLIADYSMESHSRDHENYVSVSRTRRRRAKAVLGEFSFLMMEWIDEFFFIYIYTINLFIYLFIYLYRLNLMISLFFHFLFIIELVSGLYKILKFINRRHYNLHINIIIINRVLIKFTISNFSFSFVLLIITLHSLLSPNIY